MSRARRASGGIKDMFPIGRGLVLGLIAYLLGYSVTYVLTILSTPRGFSGDSLDILDISTSDVVGWIFYNTHFVNVETTAEGFGESQSESANILSESSELIIPEPFWYAIPVLFLIISGFIVAMTMGKTHGTGTATTAGAMVFLGYLPVAIAGLFIFTASFSFFGATVSVGPNKIMGILLTGIVYPLVFGALGGFLASLLSTGSSSSSGSRSAPDRLT